MHVIAPRKTVVEARFKPELEYFQKFDGIGSILLRQMAVNDWQKTPFSVEVQDRKNVERVHLQCERVFAEFDCSIERQVDAVNRGVDLLMTCIAGMGVKSLIAVGVRQWFAIDRGSASEAKLIAKLLKIYFNESLQELAEKSTMSVKDFAITLELEDKTEPQKRGRLVLGAMSKKQWTKFVGYSVSAGGHVNEGSINSIVESLPNDFVYIDIDLRFAIVDELSSFPIEKLTEWGKFISERQKNIPSQLINDI